MGESILSAPYFHNEEAAYAFVEARVWPRGPVCPHCGGMERNRPLGGKSTRIGTYKCYDCRKPFTVKIGTIFEKSHIPMRLWLQAIFLIVSSKKGISSNQLHRTLGITLKSAWFMSHRIREAMREGNLPTFGSGGGTVEVDETFIGHDKTIKPKGEKKGRGYHHKNKVLSLVDRSTGRARSMVVDNLKVSLFYRCSRRTSTARLASSPMRPASTSISACTSATMALSAMALGNTCRRQTRPSTPTPSKASSRSSNGA